METPEQLDARIARIMAKAEALKDKKFKYTTGKWPTVWASPLSEEAVAAFEAKKGIRLPEDYRRFITTAAASGSAPFYGLRSPLERDRPVHLPFPYTLEKFPYFLYMTEEEMDAFYEEDDSESYLEQDVPAGKRPETYFDYDFGTLFLCTEGDGMDSILVVNSADPEVYGTVWFFDLANDMGIVPMRDKETGKPFRFLDWLEYWADRTAALAPDEYFSYMEAVQLPPPPDDPNIMGRKMGWIK